MDGKRGAETGMRMAGGVVRRGTCALRTVFVGLGVAAWTACSAADTRAGRTDSDRPAASRESSAATPTQVPDSARPSQHTILFAGTSLTAGRGLDVDSAYPMLIQRKIDSAGLGFTVVNAGVSGETSSGFLDRLSWLERGSFDIMVLETGANDGLRGIPPATLRANLETAIDRLRARRPDVRVLLVQMEALPNLGEQYAAEFHAVYPTVAREKSVTLLPFLLDGVAGHRELNQSDGMHPNYAGERIVAANLWKALRPILDSAAAADR